MILQILRALFVLLMAGVGWFFIGHKARPFGDATWLALTVTVSTAVLFICIDVLAPRKKLAVFSGTFLGLIVGLVSAWALSFPVRLLADQFLHVDLPRQEAIVSFITIVVGAVCCYLSISFILQTKDDVRFIIPYVEFTKQIRGPRPLIVDTSVIIDGRIIDLAETGIIDSRMIVPRFVLKELQALADQADRLKRARGRRGLDALNRLQRAKRVEVILYDPPVRAGGPLTTDEALLGLTAELSGRLLTNDHNLAKVAHVRGIEVVNINDIAAAVKPVALPGERMMVQMIKPGEEPTQGVGYLEDGTMVVVEHGRDWLNQAVEITVTNSLQTATGRMIFGRISEEPEKRAAG